MRGFSNLQKEAGHANRIIDADEKKRRSRNHEKNHAKTSLSNVFAATIKFEGEYHEYNS